MAVNHVAAGSSQQDAGWHHLVYRVGVSTALATALMQQHQGEHKTHMEACDTAAGGSSVNMSRLRHRLTAQYQVAHVLGEGQ